MFGIKGNKYKINPTEKNVVFRPRPVRKKRSVYCLNDNWCFHKGFIMSSTPHLANDADWRNIDLPHDWSIEGPFDKKNITEAIPLGKSIVARDESGLPSGEGWYRKTFWMDPKIFGEVGDGRAFLKMEGAFKHSKIWINGEFVGENRSGYTPAIYDISCFLGANERSFRWPGSTYSITIHVNAEEQQGHWHEGAGIYRDVTLIFTPSCRFEHYSPIVTLKETNSGKVVVSATLINSSNEARDGILKYRILSPDGNCAASKQKKIKLPSAGTLKTEDTLEIHSPTLWNIDNPFLYCLESELEIPDLEISDKVEENFGLRYFDFAPDGKFSLNGTPLQIRGGCIHNDFAVFGVALPYEANAITVAELKNMGCNLIRSAHHHASESLMLECDRIGMLFWAEHRGLISLSEDVQYESLRESIKASRRHPSVIIWGLANHGGDAYGETTARLIKANDIAHSEDPTRPTAVALECSSDHNINGFAAVTDLVGYNGGAARTQRDHELYPERKIIISEFGSGRGARGIYQSAAFSIGGKKYYSEDGRVFEQTGSYVSIFDLCRRTESEWAEIVQKKYLYGGIVWAAIDYLGETAGWPLVNSQMGAALDICRFRKDTYYFFQQEWTTTPMLHVFPPWEHPGQEGKEVPVWIYSNCTEIELFLNGRSMGTKVAKTGSHLEWNVIYEPGELRAVALTSSGQHIEKISVTPGRAANISLDIRKLEEEEAGEYIFVSIGLVDVKGNVLNHADNLLELQVEGIVQLVGIASGDPCEKVTIGNKSCQLFSGKALAIFRQKKNLSEKNYGKAMFFIDELSSTLIFTSSKTGKMQIKFLSNENTAIP
ncbi:MAG: Beta-galactosidase, family GH2 [Candidatus Uhrbacteria bacterium GW2011_GWF2_39_13]|uniref:Beta-galactosidase, family GH2 n=1 Tax=Candidatus Uhrbacteria bacterium GW2011_GWF2_39_13 TaxID=1618995 RepID=A0A0G0MJH8_9BACT|nr:MAG: Beta-galactosidase, family GH2 [Candidatus Uhrbacteria bacterium GW2011_GWF2_39_13]